MFTDISPLCPPMRSGATGQKPNDGMTMNWHKPSLPSHEKWRDCTEAHRWYDYVRTSSPPCPPMKSGVTGQKPTDSMTMYGHELSLPSHEKWRDWTFASPHPRLDFCPTPPQNINDVGNSYSTSLKNILCSLKLFFLIWFGLVWFLFYGSSTHFRSFRARSVNLATLFLGKPPGRFTSIFFRQ